ncbi:monofunctional biosynthetic peptidoglycan transglycosylase [Arhodomonas sp. SL1]|uniref:monofunctional biosynthetic peptidoglycan transglycosylase n=1 Tax=Arhodomonas sp. SL1 TaxID=3425691 RepID=UPI003F8805FD
MGRGNSGIARWLGRWAIRLAVTFVAVSLLLVVPLRWLDPPTSAFMLRHHYLAGSDPDLAPPRHQWVDYADISPALALAVVAAEDQRFPDHPGFDLREIRRAFEQYRRGGQRLRGASTLTQQVAKNLYLWPARSLVRKSLEAWLTLLIELTWPKRRILEVYLNIARFGPDVYGAGTAAPALLGIPPARLSSEQAALLAAALPNPEVYRVNAPSPRMRERQRWILTQMRALGGSPWLEGAL